MSSSKLIFSLPPRQVLVRMPNWLGDFVMATPILTDLRHHWPETKITALCQGSLGSLLQGDKSVDTVISLTRKKGFWNRLWNSDFLKEKYDLGILLTNSFSSAYFLWRSHIPIRIGYADHFRSLLLTHPVPFPPQKETQHLVITYKHLLEPIGIALSNTDPHLYISSAEKEESLKYLSSLGVCDSDILIGINPGAAYGSAKCWPSERFRALNTYLLKHSRVKLIYFGDSGQTELVREICRDFPSDKVLNLAGKTPLKQFISLIDRCHLFVTNDSGPMHVASALGIPLIALFGSTSSVKTGPYKGGTIIHKHVPCSPCYKRTCPLDFRCMREITAEEVYQTIMAKIHI